MAIPDLRFSIRADDKTERAFSKVQSQVKETRAGFRGMRMDVVTMRSALAGFAGGLAFGMVAQITRLPQIISGVVRHADKLDHPAVRLLRRLAKAEDAVFQQDQAFAGRICSLHLGRFPRQIKARHDVGNQGGFRAVQLGATLIPVRLIG